jgi:hypothetical protein
VVEKSSKPKRDLWKQLNRSHSLARLDYRACVCDQYLLMQIWTAFQMATAPEPHRCGRYDASRHLDQVPNSELCQDVKGLVADFIPVDFPFQHPFVNACFGQLLAFH